MPFSKDGIVCDRAFCGDARDLVVSQPVLSAKAKVSGYCDAFHGRGLEIALIAFRPDPNRAMASLFFSSSP